MKNCEIKATMSIRDRSLIIGDLNLFITGSHFYHEFLDNFIDIREIYGGQKVINGQSLYYLDPNRTF